MLINDIRVKGFLDFTYSDTFVSNNRPVKSKLNYLAVIPIVGRIAGPIRLIGSIVHTILHLIAALVTYIKQNSNDAKTHCWHALKGLTELLRGVIETIPLIGWFFSLFYDMHYLECGSSPDRNRNFWSFFIIGVESKIPRNVLPRFNNPNHHDPANVH